MSTFFGCRLASIFDTRVKLDVWNPNLDPDRMSEGGYNSSTINSNNSSEQNHDEDEFDEQDEDDDSCDDIELDDEILDDDCLAGDDETRTFLYRHITLYVIPGVTGLHNMVFMKITQPNTKGQDNNPRV